MVKVKVIGQFGYFSTINLSLKHSFFLFSVFTFKNCFHNSHACHSIKTLLHFPSKPKSNRAGKGEAGQDSFSLKITHLIYGV